MPNIIQGDDLGDHIATKTLTMADNVIDITEIVTPANPSANVGRLYVKDNASVTTLYFRDSAGTETDLLAGGGGGGEVFTWTADHSAANFDLLNIGNITSGANNIHNWDIARAAAIAADTEIGSIRFRAKAVLENYASIEGKRSLDASGQNGALNFYVERGNQVDQLVIAIQNSAQHEIEFFRDLNMNGEALLGFSKLEAGAGESGRVQLNESSQIKFGSASIQYDTAYPLDYHGLVHTFRISLAGGIIVRDSSNPLFLVFLNEASLPANTGLAPIEWYSNDEDGSSPRVERYAQIQAFMADRSVPNAEQGALKFSVMDTGVIDTNYMTMNDLGNGNIEILKPLDIQDVDIIVGTATGTKLGTSTTQKLGFWNATPIVQPTHIADPTGGATIDSESRTAINSILAQLAALGIQASS